MCLQFNSLTEIEIDQHARRERHIAIINLGVLPTKSFGLY